MSTNFQDLRANSWCDLGVATVFPTFAKWAMLVNLVVPLLFYMPNRCRAIKYLRYERRFFELI
jgi:hypothetical protein